MGSSETTDESKSIIEGPLKPLSDTFMYFQFDTKYHRYNTTDIRYNTTDVSYLVLYDWSH
jgi:hypothetical protein